MKPHLLLAVLSLSVLLSGCTQSPAPSEPPTTSSKTQATEAGTDKPAYGQPLLQKARQSTEALNAETDRANAATDEVKDSHP